MLEISRPSVEYTVRNISNARLGGLKGAMSQGVLHASPSDKSFVEYFENPARKSDQQKKSSRKRILESTKVRINPQCNAKRKYVDELPL